MPPPLSSMHTSVYVAKRPTLALNNKLKVQKIMPSQMEVLQDRLKQTTWGHGGGLGGWQGGWGGGRPRHGGGNRSWQFRERPGQTTWHTWPTWRAVSQFTMFYGGLLSFHRHMELVWRSWHCASCLTKSKPGSDFIREINLFFCPTPTNVTGRGWLKIGVLGADPIGGKDEDLRVIGNNPKTICWSSGEFKRLFSQLILALTTTLEGMWHL